MLTVPTNFGYFQNRLDARYGTIIKITDGTDTWYFGDAEMDWDSGIHVYPILLGHSGIKEGVNIFTKKWTIANISMTFSNGYYRKDISGAWVRPSDDIGDVTGNSIEIYLWCGEKITGISDCLLKYKGIINERPTYTETTINIKATSDTRALSTVLPQNKMSDAGVTNDYEDEPIPLVYGTFKYDYLSDNQWGLAKAIPKSGESNAPTCIVCDHSIGGSSNVTGVFTAVKDAETVGSLLVGFWSATETSGRLEITIITNISDALFKPTAAYNNGYTAASDADNAFDLDTSTRVTIKDNVLDNGTDDQQGSYQWSFNKVENIRKMFIKALKDTSSGEYFFRYYAHRQNTGFSGRLTLILPSANVIFTAETDDSWVDTTASTDTSPIDEEYDMLKFSYTVRNQTGFGYSGSTDDQVMAYLYEVALGIRYAISDLEYYWVEMTGREYGSWIDNAGRSNSYNSGDLIEEACFIIESILRDELGIATSDIDESSFDACEMGTTHVMRLNCIKENQKTAAGYIRQICEQSPFAFVQTAAGKYRLILLDSPTKTTSKTIPFSHIKKSTLQITSVPIYVNKLNVYSRWRQEIEKYEDFDTIENSTSETNYGTKEYTVKWQNILGSSVTYMTTHLIGSGSTGLWSQPRAMIEFETFGVVSSDLELGDWIELDDESCDGQISYYGTSWTGQQFLVIELSQHVNGTKIKALAL